MDIGSFFERRSVRLVTKVFLILLVSALSTVFFGICLPFFLLSMEVLPGLGVAGVVYVFAGGLAGLLFGGVTSACSLARSSQLVTRYYAVLFGALSVLSLAYLVGYMTTESLSRHL